VFTKATPASVKSSLERLKQLQILAYEPATDNARITFLVPRQDAARLPLDRKRLEERRQLYLDKMNAMVNYVTQSKRCRMQLLQEYFDEEETKPCETCDVCIDRKKKENLAALKDYRNQILYLLKQQPQPVDALETAVDPRDKELFIEVVRDMLDEGIVAYDKSWMLGLTRKVAPDS
jgi:ATP-dependent DNA helicase RecQ